MMPRWPNRAGWLPRHRFSRSSPHPFRRTYMSTWVRCGSVRRLLAGLLVSFAVGAVALAADRPEIQAVKKATAGGKYTKLLAVIYVPADKANYSEFNDY